MLRRSALVLAALVPSGLLVVTPATAAAETCQGVPATIVGTGPEVRGTPGDDVIVTGSAEAVLADAGNDLVCVSPTDLAWVEVDAGPGDDVVDASAATGRFTVVRLGTGLDRYVGGSSRDVTVIADGADDQVTDAGHVSLEITGPVTGPRGSYAGSRAISVASAALDVEVRLDEDLLVVGGVSVADIPGFRSASAAAPRVTVRGDDRYNALSGQGCEIAIDGLGGKDRIDANEGEWPGCESRATVRGGSGADSIAGSLGPDRIFGGVGDDRVVGRGGADLLVGGPGRDRLMGNRARDEADGGEGVDRCVVERERRCERGRFERR